MRIAIATGIYPPATSGPAQYAFNMVQEFTKRGHQVQVVTYEFENKLPTGVRHLWYFLRVLPVIARADLVLALDTFSAGLPATLAAKLLGKKIILRTGGDFLYEQYVERTGERILLSDFYKEQRAFTRKENIIFSLIRWTLRNVTALVFSTEWQRDIFMQPYGLVNQNIFVIQNRFDSKISDLAYSKKNFIFPTRNIKYKNIEAFKEAFELAKKERPEISLEVYHTLPHAELMSRLKTCYAVVMPSLGEISPHVILDAIRCSKPFILTRESGYAEMLKNTGLLVDPLSIEDMKEKILMLVDSANYEGMREAIRNFGYTHSWGEIADELLAISAHI